jgi:hypothetical protein
MLVLQVVGWAWGYTPNPYKICSLEKLLKLEVGWKQLRWLGSVEEDPKNMGVRNWRCQS